MRTLMQLTDTHIYADAAARFDGMDTRASLAAVLADLARYPAPDAFILSGDLSMDGSATSYRWLEAALAGLGAPVLAVPGNHDDPDRWPQHARVGFRPLPAVHLLPPWRLLLLDTRIDGLAEGALGAAQLAWLARLLAAPAHGCAYDLVVMHHPPLAIDSPWLDAMGLDDAEPFWTVAAQAPQLRAVVCGHVHQVFDRLRGGVRVLATPSTCVQFLPRSRHYATDVRAPGYRVLTLGDDGAVATDVRRVPLQSSAPRK